jgi:predicted anti-sigma-YlaC factor YlaD
MCPDNQLISAYFDDELDKQWSGGVESHLGECENCRGVISNYKQLNILLRGSAVPGESEIKNRMLGEIERRAKVVYPEYFWKKHLNVSIPVILAAAVLMIVFFAGVMFGLLPFQVQENQVVEEIEIDKPNIYVQVINLEDAAAYLLSDDSGFDLLITIPSSETLAVSGEPQMIREADYKRGQ